ncbi:unnamed protein product, partial [Laminaria digitata]
KAKQSERKNDLHSLQRGLYDTTFKCPYPHPLAHQPITHSKCIAASRSLAAGEDDDTININTQQSSTCVDYQYSSCSSSRALLY